MADQASALRREIAALHRTRDGRRLERVTQSEVILAVREARKHLGYEENSHPGLYERSLAILDELIEQLEVDGLGVFSGVIRVPVEED